MVDSINSHHPTGPGQQSPLHKPGSTEDPNALRIPGERQAPQPETSSAGGAGDRVEFSDAARKLADHVREASGEIPQGTLSTDRLAEIVQRLRDGFYESSDVQAEVARRLLNDL